MRAFKFLRTGRTAPFSGFTWPVDEWVDTSEPVVPCRSGIHACLAQHLAYWVMDELWEMELDDDIVVDELKIVARRGRLVGRISGWDGAAQRAFAEECVRRAAAYAVLELRDAGMADHADQLGQAADLGSWTAIAEMANAAAQDAGEADAADLTGLVGDAAAYAEAGETSAPGFIAAHAGNLYSPVGVADPFRAERESQGHWLAERLGL